MFAIADDTEELTALEAAHLQWIREVEFVYSAKTYQGTATSLEEALTLPVSKMQLTASTFHVKQGDSSRFTNTPARPPSQIDGDHRRLRDIPFDEVCNRSIQIRFEVPNPAHDRTTLRVTSSDDEYSHESVSAGSATIGPSPLAIAGRKNLAIFSFGPDDSTTTRRIKEKDSQRVVAELACDCEVWSGEKHIEFSLAGSIPVIRQVTENTVVKATQVKMDLRTIGDKFIECPGGPVASEIRSVMSQEAGRWMIILWVADDLGKRAPKNEDFIIEVPKQCRIVGLKQHLPIGTVRHVNIHDIKVEDLDRGPVRPTPLAAKDVSKSRKIGKSLIIVNGIILVVFGAYFILKRRRSVDSR